MPAVPAGQHITSLDDRWMRDLYDLAIDEDQAQAQSVPNYEEPPGM